MSLWRTNTFYRQRWIATGLTAIGSQNSNFLETGCWRVIRTFLPCVYVVKGKKEMRRGAVQLWERKPSVWVVTSRINFGSHRQVYSWMSSTCLFLWKTRNEGNATIAAAMVARAPGRQSVPSSSLAADCSYVCSIVMTVSSISISKFGAND